MDDLTAGFVETIHARIMEESHGDGRVLSEANLLQAVFNANLVQDCVLRAAFIFYSLCAYPAFREGNSITALKVTEEVLASGGYRITGENARILSLADGILAFTAEPEEIENWLRDNTRKSG
jgi:prophage maintenance system killer protein